MTEQATQIRVSVITTSHNREKTIAQAVASVRDQTYPAIEHVIVDGASRDATVERVRETARPDALIVSEPDAGIYDAFNKGVARASGEIIGFVHSDDFLATPDVIAAVVDAFQDPAVDAVYGDLDYVSADNPRRVIRRWRSEHFDRAKLSQGWMPPHPALFLHRRIYARHGAFDTSFKIAADYDFILRVFSDPTLRSVYVPRVFVSMRVGGISNRSIGNILRKSREDYRALRRNQVGGLFSLLFKNLSKLPQFVFRRS